MTWDGIKQQVALSLVGALGAVLPATIVWLFDAPSWAVAMTFALAWVIEDS
jgi:hypothetical protein